ncbi:uncharacterized protein F5891DRAFT_987478 [Suillus fuscotomentosus]|uniref:Uncharacterized protein n=1 Tax=Suillus fuscotomentosus TaxID=1912939 RepID=A0AAD4DS74_9AGAM|nr:uncharacterized protein F5891DRAFT_987478 [Suillus fuscotomentosus]KAG1889100.1 hypothetical protein F5891DRAFT_987478 [Suillus fuscotomentosus]
MQTSPPANKAFSDAADKIEHLLGQAWQLDAGNPEHLTIVMEMGRALTQAMMSHGRKLQQHMNASRTGLTGTPAWGNIRGDDIRIKLTLCSLPPGTTAEPFGLSFSATPGPSQLRKRLRWRSLRNAGEELSRGNVPVPQVLGAAAAQPCPSGSAEVKGHHYQPIKRHAVPMSKWTPKKTEDDGDEETLWSRREDTAAPVAKPVQISMEDEFANTTAGSLGSRSAMRRKGSDLPTGLSQGPRQKVARWCACSRLKIRCGSKGSEAPKMKPKSVMARRTRSQSRAPLLATTCPAAFVAPAANQEQLLPPKLRSGLSQPLPAS